MEVRFLSILIVSGMILFGCNGELEKKKTINQKEISFVKTADFKIPEIDIPEIKQEDFTVLENEDIFEEDSITGVEEKLKFEDGFILTGNFNLNSFGDGDECIGMIYRKEFEESYLYIFIDCHDNKLQQIVRK